MDTPSQAERRGEGQKSFRNRFWEAPAGDTLSSLSAQFLISRKIEDAERFCNPTLKTSMPNPEGLHGVDQLIETISTAKFVGIFGDYDVDGITSTVMWKKFLDEIKLQNCIYIPSRQDGYGASEVGIKHLLSQGVDLILFLDCGSASKELLESIPVPVCVLDHHQVSEGPKVAAIVNPHIVANPHDYIYKTLCTSGLSFLVLAKFARKLDKIKTCLSLLDLSAIGTLGDMMELNDYNRACVKRGLELINSSHNLGLSILANELNLKLPITPSHLAFYIIPCLNAAGRISRADTSFNLLLSKDVDECVLLAKTLKSLNARRKEIEEEIVQQAIISVDKNQNLIVLKDSDWHPGVVGIIASRIKEIYGKTTFILYKSEKTWKGSARSHACNVGQLIQKSVAEGLALQGGGHAAAGGVTICESMISSWEVWIQENGLELGSSQEDEVVVADGVIAEAQFGQILSLRDFGPFGNGNPAPRIILKEVWLREVVIQNNYVRCTLNSGMNLVGFRFGSEFLGLLNSAKGRYVDLLLSVDESGGSKLEDARWCGI